MESKKQLKYFFPTIYPVRGRFNNNNQIFIGLLTILASFYKNERIEYYPS